MIVAVSTGIVVAVNSRELARVTAQVKLITKDNFQGPKDITIGSVISIQGTPDVINAVSMELRNDDTAIAYFAPLQEYGKNFVVRIKRSQLQSRMQTFTGEVVGLTQTEYQNRIRTELNKPVRLTDQDRADLDAQTIQELQDKTTNDFSSATLLIQDGQVPSASVTYSNIAFWSVILSIVFITIFRKKIFPHLYNREN